MRLSKNCAKCRFVCFILVILLMVCGTAFRKDFMQLLEDEETARKEAWVKVNESHELWKLKDKSEGKLLQHLDPATLQQQYIYAKQQQQKKMQDERKRIEESENNKARIALEKQRKLAEQQARIRQAKTEEPKVEENNKSDPGEIFLPNDLEELKTRGDTKKARKGLSVGPHWKEKIDSDDTSEVDFDDNIDAELLKEKRREELLVYEQILFGEKPDSLYSVDEGNPRPFYEYIYEGEKREPFDFGKSLIPAHNFF